MVPVRQKPKKISEEFDFALAICVKLVYNIDDILHCSVRLLRRRSYLELRRAFMNKRLLSVLLAAVMTSMSLLTACSEKTSENNETTPTETQPGTDTAGEESGKDPGTDPGEITSTEERQAVPDNLPDITFNDQDYLIGTSSDKEYEVYVEEMEGERTTDAVYNRNLDVEDRFKVKIRSVVSEEPYTDVTSYVQAGTYVYDIVGFIDFRAYVPISNKSLLNWYDVPYVDLTKPWHNQLANDSATINGKIFALTSDLSISSLLYTFATFFNYRLMQDYGYAPEDLYNLVREGKWTIDKMGEVVSTIYEDDGDGEHDLDDVHGYVAADCYVATHDVWLAACDIPVMERNSDGEYEITLYNEHTIAAVDKINQLYHRNDGSFFYDGGLYGWLDIPPAFANGKVGMIHTYFGEVAEDLGEMEDTYGILPVPKFDEEQAEYYTNAWDQFTVFAVPKTMQPDMADKTGVVYEALCAGSYKTVYPAYYDYSLKSRYSAEPAVAEMVDLIMAGRKFDFTFQFGENLQNLPYIVRQQLLDDKNEIASMYQKNRKSLTKLLDRLVKLYED